MQEIKAKSLLPSLSAWNRLLGRCSFSPPLREVAAVREANSMTVSRSVLSLVLAFSAVLFASQPSNAAVLFQLQNVDRSSDGSTVVVSLGQISESSGDHGMPIPPQGEKVVTETQRSIWPPCSLSASGAKFCDDRWLSGSTYFPAVLLPTSPTATIGRDDGSRDG